MTILIYHTSILDGLPVRFLDGLSVRHQGTVADLSVENKLYLSIWYKNAKNELIN